LVAEVHNVRDGAPEALSVIGALRRELAGKHVGAGLRSAMAEAEARYLLQLGSNRRAEELRADVVLPLRGTLLDARLALDARRPADVRRLVADWRTWPVPDQIEASMLLARAARERGARLELVGDALRRGLPAGFRTRYVRDGPDFARCVQDVSGSI